MRPTGGGYTIIEVLIFLAISALIFVFAIVAVQGQQAHAEFNTAVNDVNTKFQQWADDVVNGYTTSSAGSSISNFKCVVNGSGTPQIVGGSNARGTNPDCIFLGKAIQVTTDEYPTAVGSQNPQVLYAYTVIGRRVDINGGLSSSIVDAKPIAVAGNNPANLNVTESYTIPNGAIVKWVETGNNITNAPTSAESHLVGFFTSFNSGINNLNGNLSLIGVELPYNENGYYLDGNVLSCILMQTASYCNPTGYPNDNPWPIKQWMMCLASTRNHDTAAISVYSSNGNGISTKVTYPCPGS